MTKKVDVMLADKPGAGAGQTRCRVAKLDERTDNLERHLVHVSPGEVLEWVVSNSSNNHSMQIEIGNFRRSPRYPQDRNRPIRNLFVGGCAKVVTVQPGSKATTRCTIHQHAEKGFSYKYDIIDKGNSQVILDPEIEVV